MSIIPLIKISAYSTR